MADTEKIGEIISRTRVGEPRKRKLKLELIRANWTSLAGERAQRHCRPTRLARGTLTIACESPSWASELGMDSEKILSGVEMLLGGRSVKKLRIESRPGWALEGEEKNKKPQMEDIGETPPSAGVASELARLESEELRAALERLERSRRLGKQIDRGGP